jgi:hypothetical protein
MAVAAASVRSGTDLRERLVRRVEVVGVWALDCVHTYRGDTDWADRLLGDADHRHAHATLDREGYHVDSFGVQRIAHSRGTAYVRLVCAVSIRPSRLHPAIAARTLRGMVEELLLVQARARMTYARLIDVAVVPVPAT